MSASAAFAAEDADMTAAADNDDNDDIVASVDKESSLGSKEAKNDVLKASQEITPENINQYVDKNGVINTTADEITFKGNFNGNASLNKITVANNNTKIIGENAVFNNISFYINASGVNIIGTNGLKFVQEKEDSYVINVNNADNIEINGITVYYSSTKTTQSMNYGHIAILFDNSKDFQLINSVINYYAIANKTTFSNALRITHSNGMIKNNKFNITSSLLDIEWYMGGLSRSGGIYINNMGDEGTTHFEDNTIDFKDNMAFGYYPTLYVLEVVDGGHDIVINNNNITAISNSEGNIYLYAVKITADNFLIGNNNISVSSQNYANGIDVEGPAFGVIKYNNIKATATNSAYSIYSGMNGKDTNITIIGNHLIAESYFACGIEAAGNVTIGSKDHPTRDNNTIVTFGNYTVGIASNAKSLNVFGNTIVSVGSNYGEIPVGDSFGAETAGIKVMPGWSSPSVNALISDNKIASSNKALSFIMSDNIVASNNLIVVTRYNSNNASDLIGIYADSVSNLTLNTNNVTYVGSTNGSAKDRAVQIIASPNANINNNNFTINLVSCDIDWNAPNAPVVFSEGIEIKGSDNAKFTNNMINITSDEFCIIDKKYGVGYDTIYGMDVNSNNILIAGNKIGIAGGNYSYAIVASGNFNISKNNITVDPNGPYANGINIEGPANGVIENNNINVKANDVGTAYPIYGGMANPKDMVINIKNNNISGDGYFVCGIETAGKEITVENNNIDLTGNYTMGIGSVADKLVATNNNISAQGSNVGNLSIWDGMGVETVGIKSLRGNVVINDNNITSTDKNISVSNVEGTILVNNLTKAYNADYTFQITILGIDGKGVANTNITLTVDGVKITKTTDANGTITLTNKEVSAIGAHTVSISNPVTNETVNAVINIVSRIAENSDVKMYYYDGTAFRVRALDDNGNPVGAGETVIITVGSKAYEVKTDANGYASLVIKQLPKTYTVTATYKGVTTENKVQVKQVLKTSNVKVKKSSKKLVLKAKLVNKLKGKKITFKFNGKKYAAKTNKKGVAAVKLGKKVIKKLKAGKKYAFKAIFVKDAVKGKVVVKK